LHKCIQHCKSILFADDTTLYITGKNIKTLFQHLKQDLTVLVDWFRANKLSLNLNKTNYTIFKPSNLRLNLEGLDLVCGDEKIARVEVIKFLGIYLDENLNWSFPVKSLYSKLSQSLYLLTNVKKTIPS